VSTLTGSNGQFNFNGRVVAKVRDFSLSMNREELDDSSVGTDARTFVRGMFSATGQATILIDPNDDPGAELLNSIFSPAVDDASETFECILDSSSGKQFQGAGFITSAAPSVAVGAVQAAPVTFRVSGNVLGGF
jgi:hypothetical protein